MPTCQPRTLSPHQRPSPTSPSPSLPNRRLRATEPCVRLAGLSWPIPLLAPRQNRIVVPLFLALPANPAEDYGALFDLVFAALTRAHPDLDRDEVEEWPLPTAELLEALPVIVRQTGLMQERAAGATGSSEPPDWDAIIAEFVNFLPGTTPDYWEDALTGPRLKAQYESWRQTPPVAVLVAGFVGYKPAPRDIGAIEELLRFFPDGQLKLN